METSASFEARSAPLPYPTTGKENSDSILASSLAGGTVRCLVKRRPEVPVGGAIELRKADGSGCRLLSEMEEGNTAATLFASGCSVLRSLRTRAR